MNLIYSDEAIKNLKSIGPSDQKRAQKKLELLMDHPLAGKQLEGKFSGFRSLRAWPLRIVYSFNPKTQEIFINNIDYRGGVYK